MANEHYFSEESATDLIRREIRVRIGGREERVTVANAVFSPERIDRGTEVLLTHVPTPPPSGAGLDIGCGWGPIALEMAAQSERLHVWAIDVNRRALALCAENAERLAPGRITTAQPEDVPSDIQFDVIWSNPPIRIGKAALHALLEQWIPRLRPGGEGYFVVAKNLGSDSLQAWLAERFGTEGFSVERVANAKGFRVLKVVRGSGAIEAQ